MASHSRFLISKRTYTNSVLQSVRTDRIFDDGEPEGVGPDLVDGAACLGAELEEEGRGEQTRLNPIDRGQAFCVFVVCWFCA